MTTASDPRLEKILNLVAQLPGAPSAADCALGSAEGDVLEAILRGLTAAVARGEAAGSIPIQPAAGVEAVFVAADELQGQRCESLSTDAADAARVLQYSIDQASDGVFWLSQDGGFTYVNEQACRSLGYSRDELLHLRLWDIDPSFPQARWDAIWDEWSRGPSRTPIRMETGQRRKDGSIFPVDISATHLRIGAQEVHIAIARDITERKRYESALRASESRYRALVESQVDLISRYLPDTTLTFVNSAYCTFYGKKREELIGHTMLSMVAPEYHDQIRKEAEAVYRDRKTISGEYLNYGADGSPHWIHWTVQGVLDENDQVVELQAVGHDITYIRDAEAALRESEERLQLAVRAGNIGFFDHDLRTGRAYLSPRQREIFGWSPEESFALTAGLLHIHPDDREWVEWALNRSRDTAGDGRFHAEHRVINRQGEERWVSADVLTFFEGEGSTRRAVRSVGAMADITQRKSAEHALRESEARLRVVMENLPIIVNALDKDLNFVVWNKEAERVSGYSAAEIIGNPRAWHLLYPDADQRREMLAAFASLGGDYRNQETRLTSKRGDVRTISWSSVSRDFPVPGWQTWAVGVDVTERRRAESELQRSNEMLQLILDHIPSAVLWKDRDSVIRGGNQRQAIYAGLSCPEDLVGLTDYDLPNTAPESAAAYQADDRRIMSQNRAEIDYEELALVPHAPPRWLRTSKVPLHDASGNVIGVLVVFDDITERKRMDEALRASEERFRTIVETAQEGIWLIDAQGETMYVNPRMAEMLGYTTTEMVSRSFFGFMSAQVQIEAAQLLKQHGEGFGDQHEFRFSHKAGHDVWVSVAASPATDENGEFFGVLAMVTDITERKQQEEALQKSEARLRRAQQIAHIGNWEWNMATSELSWSDEIYRIFGQPPSNSPRDVSVFFQNVYPDDHPYVQQAVQDALSGRPYDVEHRIIRPDGQIVWVEQHGQVTFDAQGKPTNMVGTTQDVTDRKKAESAIRRLNEELEQRVAERTAELRTANEEIKQFAYIVSHDLRAPLVNLKGFAGELRAALDVVGAAYDQCLPFLDAKMQSALTQAIKADIPEAIHFIETSVSSMDTFTRAILRLSRLGRMQLELSQVDTNTLVARVLAALAYQIGQRGIHVSIGSLPIITADPISLDQIFSNLLSNAVAYLVPDRPSQITISAEQGPEETVFRVQDNGRGIAAEDMEKVFAPFRRAGKQDVPGEGMGLTYVQALVRRYGGRIWCESQLGVGSTFTFTIPKAVNANSAPS